MPLSLAPSVSPSPFKSGCDDLWQIRAEALRVVREPLIWHPDPTARVEPERVLHHIRRAARGPARDGWQVPDWLMPHQRDAARRIAGALGRFGGALLADAVGLGKTYVSLAVASTYHRVTLVAPACLIPQWRRVAGAVGVPLAAVSHEALSRGAELPCGQLIVIDEAHRVRNFTTHRYDRLARGVGSAAVLLVTATPVVNRLEDLTSLLRLFLPDNGLTELGIRSLESCDAHAAPHQLLSAVLPLVVARPADVLGQPGDPRLPGTVDRHVAHKPPVGTPRLRRLLTAIDELEFPGFGDDRARALLRMHILRRLASSTAAFRQSLRRHVAYLDRAEAAATRGERLSRTTATRILGTADELQLELASLLALEAPFIDSIHAIELERERLLTLLRTLPPEGHPNPKAASLRQLLKCRSDQKTIVFTTAESTAIDLARRLRWHRVAVVASGKARIASGRISVETALALFAPNAQGASVPPQVADVSVLVATDLVSEGLDLQDASAVVHYDLPWTPERLAQRVGRVARLGSLNTHADVFWFRPPPEIERRLHLCERLDAKAVRQLSLPVPATSRVGRGRVANHFLISRERLIDDVGRVRTGLDTRCAFAVVTGPLVAVAAVSWLRRCMDVPQLLVVAGRPASEVRNPEMQHRLLATLAAGRCMDIAPPTRLLRALAATLRERVSLANCGPVDGFTGRLRRSVLAAGWHAGRRREVHRLELLDRVLNRLQQGTRIGAARELAELFQTAARPSDRALHTWLRTWRTSPRPNCTFRLDAVLFGDGSEPDPHPGVSQSRDTPHFRIMRPSKRGWHEIP